MWEVAVDLEACLERRTGRLRLDVHGRRQLACHAAHRQIAGHFEDAARRRAHGGAFEDELGITRDGTRADVALAKPESDL